MKLKRMDKAAARLISERVEEALKGVATELGLDVKVNGGRFGRADGTFTPRLTFTLQQTADGKDQEQATFERECRHYDLKPEHYKARVMVNNKPFEIVGFNPKGVRFPILARRLFDGKSFKLTTDCLSQIRSAKAQTY